MTTPHSRPVHRSARTSVKSAVINGRPVARFLLIFTGLLAAYFLLTVTFVVRDPELVARRPLLAWVAGFNESAQLRVSRPYQEAITEGVGFTLRSLGYEARVDGRQITSVEFAMAVTHGCDALELSLLLAAGLLAYPAGLAWKLGGLAGGFAGLAVLNFIRVVSLWIVGVHWRGAFDLVHFNLWPALLAGAAGLFFIAWSRRAVRRDAVAISEDGRGRASAISA